MKKFTLLNSLLISIILLSGFLSIPNECPAQTYPWTDKTPIPTGRGFTGGAVVDGKIYIIGGFPSHYDVTGVNEMYDPATDAWTEMDSMPEKRCAHATCAHNGKIYVFGGLHPDPYAFAKNDVFEYNPQTDTWTKKKDMPYTIAFAGVAVLNDTIYLIGGTINAYTPPVSTVMAYDPITETWTEKAPLLSPRAFVSTCALNGKIYVFGGADENFHDYAFKCVEVYDPATNSWTAKNNMPLNRYLFGTSIMDGKVITVGGGTDGLQTLTSNYLYDPVTDTWTQKSPMHEKRHTFFFGSVGDKMYAIGGSYPVGVEPFLVMSVEEYDPAMDNITGIENSHNSSMLPFVLQNFPNPFGSNTTITYSLVNPVLARLTVYNIHGQVIDVLVNEKQSPGEYKIMFDVEGLAGGIYYYKMEVRTKEGNSYSETRKMILTRE